MFFGANIDEWYHNFTIAIEEKPIGIGWYTLFFENI
jgi:hypothetical protein